MATAPQQLTDMASLNRDVAAWVADVAQLTLPDKIHWCDGSEAEFHMLERQLVATRELIPLNPTTNPGCFLYRSDPSDVARVEHLTYVCTKDRDDAGPNNHWMAPAQAHRQMDDLFRGCMRGRTLYVVPYCMGPIDSAYSRCGVEITDSGYVVLNMHLMTRMGRAALERINRDGIFVKGLHSVGDLNPDRRFIMHFPEDLSIKSFGSGYGGNALLGKKCHALRIASWQARTEGWLAEHMLIVGIENPQGEIHYIACAFPSACGKTNLAMLIPPASYKGWKVWTVGDDIAWLHPGKDGRLYAINPESGYFGVAPGTNAKTNRNAHETIRHDTIFTNVAVTADNQPWWEGLTEGKPVTDWQGRPYDPANGPGGAPELPVHGRGIAKSELFEGGRCTGRRADLGDRIRRPPPHARAACLSGAQLAAWRTGRRRRRLGNHGGRDRRRRRRAPRSHGDEAFCRLQLRRLLGSLDQDRWPAEAPPQIFHVNWFRQSDAGKFLWPGYGENLRVLRWIIDRCKGTAPARDTAIGHIPAPSDLDTAGLDITKEAIDELLAVHPDLWENELTAVAAYFDEFNERLPQALKHELTEALKRVQTEE